MPTSAWTRRAAGALMAVTMTVVLASCSSTPPATLTAPKGGYAADKSNPTTVAWFKQHAAVVQGLGSAPTITTTDPNYSAISAGCLSFGDNLTAAKHLPKIPQPSAQALWTYAIRQFASADAFCSAGVVNKSVSDLTQRGHRVHRRPSDAGLPDLRHAHPQVDRGLAADQQAIAQVELVQRQQVSVTPLPAAIGQVGRAGHAGATWAGSARASGEVLARTIGSR